MSMSQQRYLKAARFAAAVGRYSLASALLDGVTDEALASETDILRGHIHAQQGRYAEALGIWEKARARSPGNVALEKAIRKVRHLQETASAAPSAWFRLAAPGTTVLCVVLLLAGAFGLGRWAAQPDVRRSTAPASGPASLPGAAEATLSNRWPAGAALGQEEVLAAVKDLQRRTETLLGEQAVALTDQVRSVQGQLLEGNGAIRERLDALAAGAAKSQAVADLAGGLKTLEGDVRGAEQRLNEWTRGLSNELVTVQSQQDQLSREQAAHRQAVEAVRGDLAALRETWSTQALRSGQQLWTAIEALKPASMDRLAREIRDTEAAASVLKAEETRLRSDSSHALVSRRTALLRELQETERQLARLREDWEQHVVPWLKVKAALLPEGTPR